MVLRGSEVVNRLALLREELEGAHREVGAGAELPEDSYLLLADVCDYLGLDEFQAAVVLGPVAVGVLSKPIAVQLVS